tara:strand:- start:21 stop:1208 length:1188 start_codon:yes stop_codon:yes gene_type:complete
MIPEKLYYDFRDILKAPRIALSGKKIWIFLIGNLIGFTSYWILTYISFALSKYNLSYILNRYGLYPCLFGHDASLVSWFVYYIGIIFWIFSLFFASTAISRITLRQLKGDHLFSIYNAWQFSFKYWKSIIFTPLTILFIIIIFIIIAIFFALISSTAFLGTIIYSALFPLYFFGSIFTIYTFFVLINSFIYTPSIIASYEEDIIGSIFQSYSISWSQPWRIIAYNTLLLFLILISIELYSWFCINGYNFINFIFSHNLLMGEKLINISSFSISVVFPNFLIEYLLELRSTFINPINNYYFKLPNLFDNLILIFKPISRIETFSSILLSTFLFLLGLSIISYAFSIFSTAQTISFIIFKMLTDDDDILKRSDDILKEKETYFDINKNNIQTKKTKK